MVHLLERRYSGPKLACFSKLPGGNHGYDDTSFNNHSSIGSRRRRILWPGALVLDERSSLDRETALTGPLHRKDKP
jgi:hypothetical protein